LRLSSASEFNKMREGRNLVDRGYRSECAEDMMTALKLIELGART
jgi:hypothetical protein